MLMMLLMSTMLFYDQGVNLTPYMELLPAECNVRIDIVNRSNKYVDGYAWYSGRIIIYDGNNINNERRQFILQHELGHICSENNRVGDYNNREIIANNYKIGKKGKI
jgi:Zn-dependent peptidase ImmA (M78 family)